MKNIAGKVEIASNIAIIVIALLHGGVLVNRFLFPAASKTPPTAESRKIPNGTKLTLPDIDWSKSDKNLVLTLSTNCRYCTESAPFYQKLAEQKAGRDDMQLIAALPQDVEEGRRYSKEYPVSLLLRFPY